MKSFGNGIIHVLCELKSSSCLSYDMCIYLPSIVSSVIPSLDGIKLTSLLEKHICIDYSDQYSFYLLYSTCVNRGLSFSWFLFQTMKRHYLSVLFVFRLYFYREIHRNVSKKQFASDFIEKLEDMYPC